MRELDTLLSRWLEQQWPVADEDLRDAFRDLLNAEDDQLWDWLLGRNRPGEERLCRIVDDIQRTAAGSG